MWWKLSREGPPSSKHPMGQGRNCPVGVITRVHQGRGGASTYLIQTFSALCNSGLGYYNHALLGKLHSAFCPLARCVFHHLCVSMVDLIGIKVNLLSPLTAAIV